MLTGIGTSQHAAYEPLVGQHFGQKGLEGSQTGEVRFMVGELLFGYARQVEYQLGELEVIIPFVAGTYAFMRGEPVFDDVLTAFAENGRVPLAGNAGARRRGCRWSWLQSGWFTHAGQWPRWQF